MADRDILVIGGSAGSTRPLLAIVSQLPRGLHAAVFILIHRGRTRHMDPLYEILTRCSALTVHGAADGRKFEHGHVYVAPPGAHLSLEAGVLRVCPSPPARTPTSVDALFESAATAYGERVIGVLLSGRLNDGTAGCWQIRKHGGVVLVQDPLEATSSAMPLNGMRNVPVDYCLSAAEIGAKVKYLIAGGALPPAQRGARVMIVEDERPLAPNLASQLSDLGYDVVDAVSSGEEAMARVEAARPDVILMDVRLAGAMTGTEAGTRLWMRFQLPIIFLAAYLDQETLAAALAAMPYAFLMKPHSAMQLHAAIQLALGRQQRELGGAP